MSDSPSIAADTVVTMHYTLTLDGGEVIDTSSGREPLAYLHGHGNIVPGLEKEMAGKAVGEKFNVKVAPEEGYGVRNDEAVQTVPRGAFPPDADLKEGISFQAQDEQGTPVMGSILKVEGDEITVDFNHMLAGKTLNFAIEVMEIRAATDEEKSHGHVHGPGGHDH